jgi:hypothetical protein
MDPKSLGDLIELPHVQRMILGDYSGSYLLGIVQNPEDPEEAAIQVQIQGEDDSGIPTYIVLRGIRIPILVRTNFEMPIAFRELGK